MVIFAITTTSMKSFQSKYSLINLLLVFACILAMTGAIGREINKKPVVFAAQPAGW